MSSKNVVDYIIVGGGPAGSALAHQLGSNPQNRVLVIEAGGGSDPSPRRPVPADFVRASSGGPRYMRQYAHRPFETERMEQRHSGRVMDGSATPHGLIRDRGREADYEAWEAAGVIGWNRSRFEQAFTAIEKHAAGVTGGRDVDGPRRPEVPGPPDLASAWWIDALARHGIEAAEDLNVRHEQAAYASLWTWDGARTSTPRALLRTYGRRSNVRVRTHCEVRRILFDGTTATGVEAKTRRGTVRFTARREVVLCAGTTGNPLLLERSGVGDPEVLTAAGVHLVAANPAVGDNLRQRRGAVMALRLKGLSGRNRQPVAPAARPWSPFTHLLRRSGEPTDSGTRVLAVLSSDRGAPHPDMTLLFTPAPVTAHDAMPAGTDGATVAFYPHSPTSTGTVHITGPTLDDPPLLLPGHLSTGHDRELTVAAFARVREILATEPFASATTEVLPGPGVVATADILRYVLDQGFTGNHEVGTCALGPAGVVDDALQVRGTHRLRVADASVMPTLTTGDTTAPSMAVGWIAGDILRNANTRGR
ncbi:GMC family oxidoreductase [Streptomyces apricus]|uniref:FAD-dependent oxidoreductase n=1 Tax=Streptomyces apricus TaxID=1828112 RepID=A0A5B0AWU6_9ACTN|nr:GMC oxidoreductase [Streptomyces apricus]KAA0933721.1 FAD-dependent oxidoreductase [Streptomyces apricus]